MRLKYWCHSLNVLFAGTRSKWTTNMSTMILTKVPLGLFTAMLMLAALALDI
jgi:hypothetical protein